MFRSPHFVGRERETQRETERERNKLNIIYIQSKANTKKAFAAVIKELRHIKGIPSRLSPCISGLFKNAGLERCIFKYRPATFFIIFLHHEASEEDEDSRDEVEALKVS